MKLTAAQRLALEVLAATSGPLETWKRASRHDQRYGSSERAVAPSRINFRAAESLDRLGLARLGVGDHWARYEVEITPAGREALRA